MKARFSFRFRNHDSTFPVFSDIPMDHECQKRQNFIENPAELLLNPQIGSHLPKDLMSKAREKIKRWIAMTLEQVIALLHQHANPQAVQGMARVGISSTQTLGVSIPVLGRIAKDIGRDHPLALELWRSGIHEARILASMIADPRLVSTEQMEEWVNDFDSWDVCDQVCGNLFDKTLFAYHKAMEWPHREQEFVRRAGFVLMAELAVHDKRAADEAFLPFFPLIKQYAVDERNFVKKAVNWALRQIGKRHSHLWAVAVDWAQAIRQLDSRAARWIANDALRELQKKTR
jgi:3-methyladenine DNA glycosylase AlkD